MRGKVIEIALVLFFYTNAESGVVYDVFKLGSIQGGSGSIAFSVSDSGYVVGRAWLPCHRAVLFDSTGEEEIDLGTLGGSDGGAMSVNNYGQIVGWSFDSSTCMKATLFDATGRGNNINLATGTYKYSAAFSINDNGNIVGYAHYSPTSDYHATIFDLSGNGNNVDLGTVGGSYSAAISINNNGQIVGWSYTSNNAEAAVLFDSTGNGNNVILGGGEALSINKYGNITGYSVIKGYAHAVLFDPTGGRNNIDLGTLPFDGYVRSEAFSINDRGQIVGYSRGAGGGLIFRATLFDPTGNGNNLDLNTLIDPDSGWHLYAAYSINNLGWIVGEGNKGAFLLKPVPEPATLLLLGLGAVMVRKKQS